MPSQNFNQLKEPGDIGELEKGEQNLVERRAQRRMVVVACPFRRALVLDSLIRYNDTGLVMTLRPE